jgi:hypothetical protein
MTTKLTKKSAKRRGCLKIGLYIALALIVLLVLASYALLAVSPVPAESAYEVDLNQVR